MSNNDFKNRCYGIVIIKSNLSNFNADFSGLPRRLPDEKGTIYATDKALKYAIRKYFKDEGKDVLIWKTFTKDFIPKKLEERFEFMKNKLKINGNKPNDYFKVFGRCLDVKLFGLTFAVGKHNYSITGPVQISYGINQYSDNTPFSNQILSPFNPEGKGQSTIGSEAKSLESHYVFDFVINPKNLKDHYEDLEDVDIKLTENDIKDLKESLKKGVTNLTSTTKMGSENELLLFITLNENSKIQLPTLKDKIKIEKKESGKYKIDFSSVDEVIGNFNSDIKTKEIYYDDNSVEIETNSNSNYTEKNIFE